MSCSSLNIYRIIAFILSFLILPLEKNKWKEVIGSWEKIEVLEFPFNIIK